MNIFKRIFSRARIGPMIIDGPMRPAAAKFFEDHPPLRIVDVTNAESGTEHGGHGYFRTSPWPSCDILMALMHNPSPEECALVEYQDFPVRDFPENYVERLRESLSRAHPAFAAGLASTEP